jgi:DUF4097 and DUF4098 domain-containing protein YvlB
MSKFWVTGLAAALAASSAQAEPIDRTIVSDPQGELEVNNLAGSIEITGWDRNEVHVTGELQDEAERLDVEKEENRIVVRVVLPQDSGRGFWRGSELHISAPRGVSVEASSVSADIRVRAIEGEQRLQSVSGNVETRAFERELRLKSVSGNVTVHGDDTRARTQASVVSGNISIDGVGDDVEAQSISGRVRLRARSLQRAELESISGDVDLEAGLADDARINATTTSGRVKLMFNGGTGGDYELSSFSGGIDNCFGPEPAHNGPGSRRELRFSEGDGDARVYVRTMSGSIELCRQ